MRPRALIETSDSSRVGLEVTPAIGLSSHQVRKRLLNLAVAVPTLAHKPRPVRVQCIEGENDYHRVCVFKDIYMYNGLLYYVVPEEGKDPGPWLAAS